MPGRLDRRCSSTTIPSSTSRPARSSQLDPRRDTDTDDDDVGGLDLAVVEHDLLDAGGAPQLDDAALQTQPDAVVGVQPPEHLPDLAPRTRWSGTGEGSTSTTSAPIWRADAATSEPIHPAPTTTTRPAPRTASPSRTGVAEPAEVVDAVQIGAGDVEPSRRGARRQDRGGERHPARARRGGSGRRPRRRPRRCARSCSSMSLPRRSPGRAPVSTPAPPPRAAPPSTAAVARRAAPARRRRGRRDRRSRWRGPPRRLGAREARADDHEGRVGHGALLGSGRSRPVASLTPRPGCGRRRSPAGPGRAPRSAARSRGGRCRSGRPAAAG